MGNRAHEYAYEEGMRRFESGDLAGAAQAFERALAADSAFARAHYQLGNVRQDEGRWSDAERHFRAALALAPDHAEAHNNLGVALQMLGRGREAEACYARAAELGPALVHPYLNLGRMLLEDGRRAEGIAWLERGGARSAEPETFRHTLSALRGEIGTEHAPDAYVRNTFDGFAGRFDHRMDDLGYRVPDAIARALGEIRPLPPASADVLDLGCGTGLSGLALRGIARTLTGVDLAPKMLEHARTRGCYDVLADGELLAWLRSGPPSRYDVVVAADVLIYVGALEELFAQAARVLRPDGLLAFSVEICDGAGWKLQESGRYAHSDAYVRALAGSNGFTVALQRPQPIRTPIVGQLYVLARGRAA